MKGQMFLIATLVIISSLFIARYSIGSPDIERQKLLLEMNYEGEFFENLEQELGNSIIFSSSERENITANAYDFMNFSRAKSSERGWDLKIFFTGIYSNRTNSSLLISTINLLDKDIAVTLNLSGSAKNKQLSNYEQWDTFYSINPGSNYWLHVKYDDSAENLTLTTSSTNDVYFFYFDLNLTSENSVHAEKIEERMVLP